MFLKLLVCLFSIIVLVKNFSYAMYEYKVNEALADHMQRFIEDPGLACEMGQKAYEWAKGRFTGEENVSRILELYGSLAEERTAE